MKNFLLFIAFLVIFSACSSTKNLPRDTPGWLRTEIKNIQSQPVENPPAAVYRYTYHGNIVYFIPGPCCDQFSRLFNERGDLLGHPDGGITGRGDGKFPDFFTQRSNEQLIWTDDRRP